VNDQIRLYWQYLRLKWRAGREARTLGELAAAQALWALNRVAKEKGGKTAEIIYRLKSVAIKYWYLDGRCLAVGQQKQDQVCNRCGGDGDDPYRDGECVRCGGSGIWKSHWLYVFTLEIGGEVFQWHQPESMVNYPVDVDDSRVDHFTPAGPPVPANYDYEYGYCLVLEYLRQQGLPDLPELLTLRRVVRRVWKESRLFRRIESAKYWVRKHLPRRELITDDEIPF
jgi:hypothetical protein